MPIHIPEVAPPLKWTKKKWSAYQEWYKASMNYVEAYGATIGIFAIFSPKKNKAKKKAEAEYRKARDNYNKIVWSIE